MANTNDTSCSILLIDPDSHGRALVRRFLAERGVTVVEAPDGETGIALAQQHQPPLVLTEILLAKLDGLSVCRQLKAQQNACSVGVISFLFAPERASEAGADWYLAKPVQKCVLLSLIDGILDRSAA